jgi:hypothetical protein
MLTYDQANIQRLGEMLKEHFPDARMELDLAEHPNGESFLDIERDDHYVVIGWRSGEGFGISCSDEIGFGVGADEVYRDPDAAYARVVSLLREKSYTRPPVSNRIHELRQARGITQEALAALLSVRQSGISKLERRDDVLVSTVREVVRSMGGELTITARFPDGMQRTLVFDAPGPPPKKQERKTAKPKPSPSTRKKPS